MRIALPARVNNDEITLMIDHLNADEEGADKDLEKVSTTLIDQYRDELESNKKLQKLTMGNCPLIWWKERTYKFPNLSKLAQSHSCILATSALSEQIFSMAGRLISNFHCRLSCKTSGMIIFIN